jgi:hypothetical protein
MKNYLFIVVITLFYSVFTSCTADKAQPKVNSELSDIITSGTWKITHYSDHGDIETSHFYDYTFTFTTDGRIIANDGPIFRQVRMTRPTIPLILILRLAVH